MPGHVVGRAGRNDEVRRRDLGALMQMLEERMLAIGREAMLQQLESSIQLMHQELETLLREVLIRQAEEEET